LRIKLDILNIFKITTTENKIYFYVIRSKSKCISDFQDFLAEKYYLLFVEMGIGNVDCIFGQTLEEIHKRLVARNCRNKTTFTWRFSDFKFDDEIDKYFKE